MSEVQNSFSLLKQHNSCVCFSASYQPYPWILKWGGLENSDQRLISLNIKTRRIGGGIQNYKYLNVI